jgi:multidrug transporter EmrE-like cation transporter
VTPWIFLVLAIASEIVATLSLRGLSAGFRWDLLTVIVMGYALSFALLVPALKHINVGISYAIWSAVGTAAIAVLGVVFFGERLNAIAISGLLLIVLGVVLVTASGSSTHG